LEGSGARKAELRQLGEVLEGGRDGAGDGGVLDLEPAEADVGEGRHLLLELRADTSCLAQLRRKRARESGAVEIEKLGARSEEKLAGSDPWKRRPTPITETPHQAN